MEVYLVYVIYEYDGYDGATVYSTKEKAIDAADQLLFEFQQDGFKINTDYADEEDTFSTCFSELVNDGYVYIRLGNSSGDVEIVVERKQVY